MVTHLGSGSESTADRHNVTTDRHAVRAKSYAGHAVILHIQEYMLKGFKIKRVTSDGEGSIKSFRPEIEALGVQLNILGHGSHTPHAESAIRYIKNKARAVLHSLTSTLPQLISTEI